MQSGDVLSLLPAVRRLAWRVLASLPGSVEHDDLVQAGTLGILEAAHRAEGDTQAAYLLIRARGAMLDHLRLMDTLTIHERRKVRALDRARDRLERRHMRPATLAEVASEAGVSVEDAAAACDVAPCGLDDAMDVCSDHPDPSEALAALRAVREAARRYQRLDGRWRTIVDDWLAERPQVETAAELGVTPGRVTQIRKQAVERIAG